MKFKKFLNENFPIFIINDKFEIVFTNKAAQEIYGNIIHETCYKIFKNSNEPCFCNSDAPCPVKIMEETGIKRFSTYYKLKDNYVIVSTVREGNFFIQKHMVLQNKELASPFFKEIIDILSEGVIFLNKDGTIKLVNSEFLKVLGIQEAPSKIIGKNISQLNPGSVKELLDFIKKGDKIPDKEEFILHIENRYFVIKKLTFDLQDFFYLITEKKDADLGNEIFRVLLESAPVGIFLQCDGIFIYANPIMASILESSISQIIGASIFKFVHPDYKALVRSIAEKRKRGERFRKNYSIKIITEKGNEKWIEITSETVSFLGKNCGVGSIIDITDKVKFEERLRELATIDQLTGIYNRYAFKKFLEEEINRAGRYKTKFALIMFDIDDFKKINDTYGHQIGDKVLREIADIVKEHIRKGDIFGRWGGEEFMIIAPIKKKEDGIEVAEKIRKIIENHKFPDINNLTVSLGISFYKDGDNLETLLRRADTALYEAKKTGKNKTVVAD